MRNAVMAAILVAAGVSSNYVPRIGGSENPAEAVERGEKMLSVEPHLPQPIDDPFTFLNDYLHPLLNDDVRPKSASKNLVCPVDSQGHPKINFMVATVPDPERTHLSLYFDRFLEAIIFAAGEEHFSYDRYWLPWHVEHELNHSHVDDQDKLDARGEDRHRKPGIIIFRETDPGVQSGRLGEEPDKKANKKSNKKPDDIPNTLVVFLVGETPTSGINRHQFLEIVDYIQRAKGCDQQLRVLGPTFSGSAQSLKLALRNFPVTSLSIISGTVTNLGALQGLAASTIHSEDFVLTAMYSYLSQLRIAGDVAVVKEAATDYGAYVVPQFGAHPGIPDPTYIYYPREISRLRNAFPEQANSAAAQVANLQQQLSLRLRDSRAGEDTLPQFSDQTPLSQESVLLQISETLRRDHIGLAVITGTDVLDVMFLSRHLRDLNPDVRLALWNSDLLFVHGTDTLDFTGMLAINTYPLIPANLDWTSNGPSHYYFQSDITEGIYNACRLLLNPNAKGLREYSAPGSANSTRPPLWLSVIGHDAYWPLKFIEDPGSSGDAEHPGDPPLLDAAQRTYKQARATRYLQSRTTKYLAARRYLPGRTTSYLDPGWPTRAWSFIFYSCSLLAVFYAGIYIYLFCWTPMDKLPRWCSLLHPRPYWAPPFWRADYSLLLTLALLLAYLSFFSPVARLAFENPKLAWHAMLWAGMIVTIGLLAVAVLGLWRSKSQILTWILAVAAVAAGYWTISLLCPLDFNMDFNNENFFRALRSVQLGSGVGPSLPLFFLFLAFAWWASIEMQRARLVAEHRHAMPSVIGNGAAANVACLNQWLGQTLLYVDTSGWFVAAAGFAAAFFLAVPHVRSVDEHFFDVLICALVIPLTTLLFLRTYAFLRIWCSLRRLLDALESRAIRAAFSNLPNDLSWSPLWQYGARRKTYTVVIRSLESLKALQESCTNYYRYLAEDIAVLDDYLNQIMEQVNRGFEEPIPTTQDLQARLEAIANDLSMKLQNSGWNERSSETVAKLEKASEADKVKKGFAIWRGFTTPSNFQIRTAPAELEPDERPNTLAAEIVALHSLAYIRYVIRHLRNLLSFLTTGFILLTLAVNSYPFQALDLIRWSITGIFLLMTAVLIYVFQGMSRNEILGRITDTKAGSLDSGFYARMISVGALPVLAVVASHFPSVGRFLFSWVQPAISALH